nr:hypothetical protein OHA15_41460 [Streptomyces anthocyanicus]
MTLALRRQVSGIARHTPKGAAAALVVASLMALTACGSSDQSSNPESAPPVPSETPSPSTASPSASSDAQKAHTDAVTQAYQRFWEEQVKAYSKGSTAGTDMTKYAAAEALANIETDLKDLRGKGIVTTGGPSHDVSVDALQLDKKVPYAKLTDCLDSGDWSFIYVETEKPVSMPTNRLVRYVTQVEAEKWGKQWKIVTVTPEQRAC